MAHNFRKQLESRYNPGGWPYDFVSKAGSDTNNAISTPDAPLGSVAYGASVQTPNPTTTGEATYFNSSVNRILIIGAGQYSGMLPGCSKLMIGDGKVIISLDGGNLLLGNDTTNEGTQYRGPLVAADPIINGAFTGVGAHNITFRFINIMRASALVGGSTPAGRTYTHCVFEFLSNAGINISHALATDNPLTESSYGDSAYFYDCVITRLNGFRVEFVHCLLFNTKASYLRRLQFSYVDSNSTISFRRVGDLSRFQNCNVQGLLRVEDDTFGYTDLATFKVNYGLQTRLDLIDVDPQFNKASAEDYTLKIISPHLDFQIGPTHLRYALMYYVDSAISPDDVCTIGNTRLKSTADGALISFREISGFTINSSGGLVIAINSQGNFEGYYTTGSIPVAATTQRVRLLPVISGLNFDTAYPANETGFSSVLPEVYNNNVPDYSNSGSGLGPRNPNRLTVQARFSTLANPDESVNEHWTPNNGTYYDFEIDEEPFFDSVAKYGSGHPLFNASSANVRPVLARFIQVRYKSRNDYFSK